MRRRTWIVLTCTLALGLIAVTASYFVQRYQIEEQATLQAQQESEKATSVINSRLGDVLTAHRDLIRGLNTGVSAEEDLENYLCQVLSEVPLLFGVGAAFAPREFSDERYLFAPYCREQQMLGLEEEVQDVKVLQIEDSYDYTSPEHDWYHLPMIRKGEVWQEPHHGTASGAWIVNITSPFFSRGEAQSPTGVGFSSISLTKLQALLASLELGQKGYSFLVSEQGQFIVHPRESYLGKSVVDMAERQGDAGLKRIAEAVDTGQPGFFVHDDDLTGESSWVFYRRVETTGWTLVVVLLQEEMAHDLARLYSLRTWIVVQAVVFTAWIAWMFLGIGHSNPRRARVLFSVAVTLVLVAGSVVLIFLELQTAHQKSQDIVTMTSREGLEEFLADYDARTTQLGRESAVKLPTGLFVQSVDFSSSNDVDLTGYVWQRYSDAQLEQMRPGFVFPEAIQHQAEEVFRRRQGDEEVIGWYFETTLRQSFDYSRYPFDSKQIWIRIWHRDFDKNIVLVPDLEAYSLTNPSAKPGLEEDIVAKDWLIARTFFGYKQHNYSTDFGLDSYVGQDGFPELYFNILALRESGGALVVHFVLLIVVAVMLYAMLASITLEETKNLWIGYNFLGLLGGVSGLFFVLNIAHIQLRTEVPENLVFLEWFYFLMYLVILVTTVIGFQAALGKAPKFFVKQDFMLPKLLYWPLMGSFAFCVSFIFFT